jgi:hypothetical protein
VISRVRRVGYGAAPPAPGGAPHRAARDSPAGCPGLLAPLTALGQDYDVMEIAGLPATRFDLPGREEPVYVATQRWALEPWEGADPPSLAKIWSRKPKFAVNGSRSCAELAIVHHLRDEGWHGVWVNSFGPRELRSEWFPAPAVKTLAATGAPGWAVEAFERLRAANGGTFSGFFDVFAWREPSEVSFYEVKVGPDRIRPTQLRFVDVALRFHRLEQFKIIEVAAPSVRGKSERRAATTWEAAEQDTRPPTAERLRSNRQEFLRGAARELLRTLNGLTGPDEPETRETLGEVAAAIKARQED